MTKFLFVLTTSLIEEGWIYVEAWIKGLTLE